MSSWPILSHDQAKELARFINALRPDWDVPGVIAQLGYARALAPGPELGIAAIRAAMNANNRTPAVIPMDGEHWRTTSTTSAGPRARPVDPAELCRVCGKPEAKCELYRRATGDQDHRYEPVGVPGYVDTTTGELAPPVDHSAHREQLRAAMASAHAMPE